MTPGKLPIDIYAFATFKLPLQWKDGAGVPVDLTGYRALMQIRERASSAIPVISLDNALLGGIVMTNASQGQFEIDISEAQTGSLTIKAGFYDIVLVSASGDATRLLEGAVTIHPGITRY